MKEVVKFLTENPVQYLATVGTDGKAKCRPFGFCLEYNGKLWFSTDNQKSVYRDMQENPNIQISITNPAHSWIRISAKAVFENNMAVKKLCMNIPIIKGIFGKPTNPTFEVFYLADAKAIIYDFSDNPPVEFIL